MFNVKQRGLSPVGILFVSCAFAFFVMAGLKLGEHYIDYNTIRAVFKEVGDRPGIKQLSTGAKYDEISKALTLNNIREWSIRDNAYFSNEAIGFAYEQRIHMFANIDVVLSFEYEAELE